MSVEDRYGPALKRARRKWLAFTESQREGDYKMLHVNMLHYANEIALAQAEETSRLADEQETANLIAYMRFEMEAYGWSKDGHPPLVSKIRDRLGL